MQLGRRQLLLAAIAAPFVQSAAAAEVESAAGGARLDLHVHLFGVGDNNSGCRMSEKITGGLPFQGLLFALDVRSKGKSLDEGYEAVLAEQIQQSSVTRAAILGQDAVYSPNGKVDWDRTSFYVPNDYVFEVVARHRESMIPCPSINPLRGDALEELSRIREHGANLFKIHPPTQGVDISDQRHKAFFRRCAELKFVVLVHTGHEHSAPVLNKHLAAPERLTLALEQGCTVVACHAGSGWESDQPDQLPQFVELLKKYPEQLWGDTAVLGTSGRVRDFMRLLEIPFVRERLLHGSDFPFPAIPVAFAAQIGREAADRITKIPNWITRDLELKEALGIGNASAKKSHELLEFANEAAKALSP